MTYEPRTWHDGDTPTGADLTRIENGIASMDGDYVPMSALVPIALMSIGFHQDELAMSATTDATVILGGDPLPGSLKVFVDGILTTNYTATGRRIAITADSGAKLVIDYAYDKSKGTPEDAVFAEVITDSFNRSNSSTSLGNADTGESWQALAGTWGIANNQAFHPNNSSMNDAAGINSGAADVSLQAKIVTVGAASVGVFVRATDSDNMIDTNMSALYKRENGTNTSLGSFSTAFAEGDTIRITTAGSTITVYRQAASTGSFSQVLQVTSTFNQSKTLHGLRTSNDNQSQARWDDFQVTT